MLYLLTLLSSYYFASYNLTQLQGGHGGIYDFDNNWLNTGSGVQKGLISKWREEVCPDKWEKQSGRIFTKTS